ncbi:aldolase [Salipiger aestuarii]|nr:aldolase [Salipiger aestuarii]
MPEPIVLDCTFRDGGYYNSWDFPGDIVNAYLVAMKAASVDVVEMGFRFLSTKGFKGATAYTNDDFLRSLVIPEGLTVAVMVNGSDLLTDLGLEETLERLFPEPAASTPVELVRFACHFHEFERVLPAVGWLHERGYRVGFNLMQITDRSRDEVVQLARSARSWPVEVLYFADSMGSMSPQDVARIVGWLREEWEGPLGIHTHDNMGRALANTLAAMECGVTWLDSTVTGMGRGPGNARTEELVIEAEALRDRRVNLVPLMALIRSYFGPMKARCGWGSNPYYYLSGKYGIHPTYIQEMLADPRYDEEDILAVIDHLRAEGGKKFSADRLHGARNYYSRPPSGTWRPSEVLEGRDVFILGSGPGVADHRSAIEAYIRRARPVVLALNTQSAIAPDLIDYRVACHPVRLLADSDTHATLPQPLIAPISMLPDEISGALGEKAVLDFGLGVVSDSYEFHPTHCIAPTALVLSYALAVATSGAARRILMAGFDGYDAGDPRNDEIENFLDLYTQDEGRPPLISVGPSRYRALALTSIYAM